MNALEIFFLSFVIGFVTNYLLGIKYLKFLRGEGETKYSDIALISCSLIWGSLIYIILYLMFNEYRIEDAAHNKRFIISEIIIFVIQIAVIVTLSLTGVFTIETSLAAIK